MINSTAETLPRSAAFYFHPRREPFEYGLLPIPKLIFTDGIATLATVKKALLANSNSYPVSADSISYALDISLEHAQLVLDTLVSVLPFDSDPLLIESYGVDVYDLLLFLYIQSYKRLLPRTHKDSASVADVWPSTSAFDGYLSALSPLQLARSNSRRFMPSQADEEAHQLSYLQKHMGNILSLLADAEEGEGEESLFERLEFLIQISGKGPEGISLSQAAPIFANSDADMPAVPILASQVHDWLLENIASTLEHISERLSSKQNGPSTVSDQGVSMTDACLSSVKASMSVRGPCFIEGISKASYVKHASDLKGDFVKVINCHDSVIYILAPLKYATIYGCSDATVVLGAVGKAVRVEHCERVNVITAAKRICIANCRECVFFLGVNQRPLIVGDNHKLQVAPFNTFYPHLEDHMKQVGVEATVNKWNEPLTFGVVDPHDSLTHPAGVSDALTESASCLGPDQLTNFIIPSSFVGDPGSTKDNPFPLPESYMESQQRNLSLYFDDSHDKLMEIKQMLRDIQVEDSKKREISSALHIYFGDWLYASGNIRQLYYLHGE